MIRLENVTKAYRKNSSTVLALDAVNFEVERGEFVAVRGPSGSGKTTLLFTAGAMLRPDSGRVLVTGTEVYSLSSSDRSAFRARRVGFIFQTFHLLPYLSVVDNVLLAVSPGDPDRRKTALDLLDRLGLGDRVTHVPSELSAGESQRTAVARALVNRPELILADEPTGNLDAGNAAEVFRHLKSYHEEGATVVVVTHGPLPKDTATRLVELRGGRIRPE